jgi:hypothetical protein
MELLAILRVLRHHRLALAIGVLLSILVFILAVYSVSLNPPSLTRKTQVTGVAMDRVLVNTKKSLVADTKARGVESIVARASFLGNLLAGEAPRRKIARRLDVKPEEVEVLGPGAGAPTVKITLAEQATEVARPHSAYVVSVQENSSLPILTIETAAPDPQGAGRLADVATSELIHLSRASPVFEGTVDAQRIGVASQGPKLTGGSRTKGLMAAVFMFVVWITAIVFLDAFRRRHGRDARRRPSGALAGAAD